MWKRSSARAVVIGGALAALVLSARLLSADGVPARVPVRVVRARPMPPLELPVEPAIAWQARMLEPILGAPVADGSNLLVIAHASGLVVELDANGRTRAAIRAASSLALGPFMLASRRRVVVTGDAEAVVLLPSGRIESRQKLSFRELDVNAKAVSTSDGGLLVGAGARFARLGPAGALTASGGVREALRAVFDWRGLGVLVERGGRVLGLGHAGDPYELASFARPVRAAELHGKKLLALVADRDLVELDLETRSLRTLWSEPQLAPRDALLLPNGDVRIVASSNLLVALDSTGREAFRVAQPGPSTEASVALLGDAKGVMLVATGGLDLRLVDATGDIVEIPGTACLDPLRPTPLSRGLVVASCRSGLLFGISGKAR